MRVNLVKLVYGLIFLTGVLIVWRTVENYNNRGATTLDYGKTARHNTEGQILSEARQGKQGYVLTLRFTGQQVAGLRGIFSQQCWLKLFNYTMSIVEPFMRDSVLSHSKELWMEEEKGVRLSNLYQMPQNGMGLGITSWKTFLSVAPKKVIVLTIQNPYAKECLVFKRNSCIKKVPLNQQMLSNCSRTPDVLDAISYLESKAFVVVRTVCLICDKRLCEVSPKDITEYIFEGYKPEDVTLLINTWRFSFEITPDCKRHQCHHATDISPHPKLIRDAHRHTDVLKRKLGHTINETKGWTSIAFMMRLEWFIISKREKSLEEMKLCFADIRAAISTISQDTSNEVLLLLALDIGKFGSGTFEATKKKKNLSTEFIRNLEKEVKDFVSLLYKNKISFDEWEESFEIMTGGNADRGYVAALQMQEVRTADCLILMGGGHFQLLALDQYIKSNPTKKCIHTVCIHSPFERKIRELL